MDRRAWTAHGAPPPAPDTSYVPGVVRPPIPPAAKADTTPTFVVFPWWTTSYSAAQDWSCKTILATAAANATTVLPTTPGNFLYSVPANFSAVLKSLTLIVQAPTNTMNLSLTLLAGNAPIQGWVNRMIPPGSGSTLNITWNDIDVRLYQGTFFTASLTEGGGSNWTVSCEASGWQIMNQEIERVQQGNNY